MKSLFTSLALALTLTACSSSKDDAPALSPFQKASGGQWLSECQQDNTGNYRETLSLNGTTGTTTSRYFQNTDCSGAIVKTEGPTNFTYSSVNKAGGKDGEGTVTLNYPGKPAVTVEVIVQGNVMVIIAPNRTIIYNRIGGGPGKQGQPGTPMAAFDAVAKGVWATVQCFQYNGGGTVTPVLQILGGGVAKLVNHVYQSNDCTGNPQGRDHQDLRYEVTNFMNGGGQLMVNGNPIQVSIRGGSMTLGNLEYQKIQ